MLPSVSTPTAQIARTFPSRDQGNKIGKGRPSRIGRGHEPRGQKPQTAARRSRETRSTPPTTRAWPVPSPSSQVMPAGPTSAPPPRAKIEFTPTGPVKLPRESPLIEAASVSAPPPTAPAYTPPTTRITSPNVSVANWERPWASGAAAAAQPPVKNPDTRLVGAVSAVVSRARSVSSPPPGGALSATPANTA